MTSRTERAAPLRPAEGRIWRIGLVGAGNISAFHLQAWANCPNAKVAAIADPNIDRARTRADKYGNVAIHPDIEAMLAAERLDALDILSPRETHGAMVRRAAEAGLPAICQKPLTNDLAQSLALVRDVESRIRLMVNENSRFRPQYRQIGEWLKSGRLGEVCQVRDSIISSGLLSQRPNETPPDILLQPFLSSERRLLIAEVLIHHIDTLRSLLGPLRLISAHARKISERVVGEDMATILLETRQACPVVVEGNRSAPGMPPAPMEKMLVAGTQGTVLLAGLRLRLLGSEPETIEYERIETIQAGFDFAARHFIECLDSGNAFETAAADNLDTLELVEDAYRAAGLASPKRA